jgi:hypothetical protein
MLVEERAAALKFIADVTAIEPLIFNPAELVKDWPFKTYFYGTVPNSVAGLFI